MGFGLVFVVNSLACRACLNDRLTSSACFPFAADADHTQQPTPPPASIHPNHPHPGSIPRAPVNVISGSHHFESPSAFAGVNFIVIVHRVVISQSPVCFIS